MTNHYERLMTTLYLRNFIAQTKRTSCEARVVDDWLESNCEYFDIEYVRPTPPHHEKSPSRKGFIRKKKITPDEWSTITSVVQSQLDTFKNTRLETFDHNLLMMAKHFNLDAIEKGIFDLVWRHKNREMIEDFFESLFREHTLPVFEIIARMLGVKRTEVERRLSSRSKLQKYGLLICQGDFNFSREFGYSPSERLLQAMSLPANSFADIQNTIISPPAKSELLWDDYEHISTERDYVCNLLKGAVANRTRGVNILLYGGAGTGKTEFAKVLTDKIGLSLYCVGETDDRGGEPLRHERLADILLCQQLLSGQDNSIILFDEMDDLIIGGGGFSMFSMRASTEAKNPKIFLNRLLENNQVPAIWITNSVSYFDPAVLRRMTMALEMRTPTVAVRERVWNRTLEREGLSLPEGEARHLAREFEAPPGLAVTAVRGAKLAGAGVEQIRLSVRATAKAMAGGQERPPTAYELSDYNPGLINPDIDLVAVAETLARPESPRNVSFCLYGPPGTGKSAFARYLAESLGMEVLHKRASDLISMWVGGTEKNIANAFAEARSSKSVLILDEADSLLRDRGGAHHSWEVGQVNEMLTWMEVHDLPFVCTTNLMEGLDRASLRRFTFKVECDYLKADQSNLAFSHFFELDAPDGIAGLSMLTPGDFALVKRKAIILGASKNKEALFNMLAQECAAKPGHQNPIGFMVNV